MTQPDEAQTLLASVEYGTAFTKVMSGNDADLTDDERALIARARRLTATDGLGLPMPAQLDPTRNGDPAQ